MSIEHVLAVVPVSDIDAAQRVVREAVRTFRRQQPDALLVEWQVVHGGWVQVFVDEERAGSGLFNVAVDDLETHIAEARSRGLEPGEVVDAAKGVRLSTIVDPDGNVIRLIGGFRVDY